LPAAAATTMPRFSARSTAASKAALEPPISGRPPPSDRLMTSAPWSVAQSMPAATWSAVAVAVVAEHAHGEDLGPGRHRLDPDAVAGQRVDDAGHVGAVAVAVLRRVVVVDEVVPREGLAREVGMVGLDAGVDDGDHRAGSRADRVRAVGVNHVQPPLAGPQRVGPRRRRAARTAGGRRPRSLPGGPWSEAKDRNFPMRCT
jgi:hypothetical protein